MGILVQAVQGDDESTEEERRKEQAPLPGMTDEQEDTIVEHDVLQDREDVKAVPKRKCGEPTRDRKAARAKPAAGRDSGDWRKVSLGYFYNNKSPVPGQ